jgi:hypothetical protein
MIGVDRRGSERRFNFVRGAAGRCHFPSPSSQFDHGGVQYEGMHKPVFVCILHNWPVVVVVIAPWVGRFGGVGLTWAAQLGFVSARLAFPRLSVSAPSSKARLREFPHYDQLHLRHCLYFSVPVATLLVDIK